MTPDHATRMNAVDRRAQVLAAALPVFARDGYEGTSTEDVAKAAGISQPYLFRIFETKKALFIAIVEDGFGRVRRAFTEAVGELHGEDALSAMGSAYATMLKDRELLLMQMHAYSACADPEIRGATRRAFSEVWQLVTALSGESPERVTEFFAHGMLLNVVAALDASELADPWVGACLAASPRPPVSRA